MKTHATEGEGRAHENAIVKADLLARCCTVAHAQLAMAMAVERRSGGSSGWTERVRRQRETRVRVCVCVCVCVRERERE